jgi:hypothetical protein
MDKMHGCQNKADEGIFMKLFEIMEKYFFTQGGESRLVHTII